MPGRRRGARVRFLRQWVLNTRSDHHALFVHVQIRGRRRRAWGPWRDLLLISANMGGRFDDNDLERILATTDGLPFVVFLQEAGDQPWLPEFADDHSLSYVGGRAPGEASTPMLVSPEIDVRGAQWHQILGRVKVGRGAGPDVAKAKGMHRTCFRLAGVRFGASSIHQYASQQNRPRLAAAIRLAAPMVRSILHLRRPYFLVGDWNSATGQPLSRWLLAHGLTTNAEQLGQLDTHGHRDIDRAAVQRRLVAARPDTTTLTRSTR